MPGCGMRIMIINPDYGMTDDELRARIELLGTVCGPDTQLSMRCLTRTPVVIDSLRDVALASPEIIDMADAAQADGYDAIVLYCFSDPALEACREVLSIPVVGAGRTALLLAASLGYRLSLLTASPLRDREKRHFIAACGLAPERVASVRSVRVDTAGVSEQRDNVIRQLAYGVQSCVQLDGADTVVLGCLSFAGLARELSDRTGVPVVDPAFAAVLAAESIVKMRLAHSKAAYPYPPSCGDNY